MRVGLVDARTELVAHAQQHRARYGQLRDGWDLLRVPDPWDRASWDASSGRPEELDDGGEFALDGERASKLLSRHQRDIHAAGACTIFAGSRGAPRYPDRRIVGGLQIRDAVASAVGVCVASEPVEPGCLSSYLFPIALVCFAVVGCAPPEAELIACTPGRQIACACGGGREGYQTCWDDGSGYGACVGCGDAGGSSGTDVGGPVDASGSRDVGDASGDANGLGGDGGGPDIVRVDVGEPDRVVPDSGVLDSGAHDSGGAMGVDSAGPSFAWVWVDRGGPAFQPHACRAGAGVVGGMLVDPAAFFSALVARRDPNEWTRALSDIEPELWACGVGQQRGSGGNVRGRLFLPTASCPDASPPPGDATATRLGVRQESSCWSHAVDVVEER